MRADIDALDEPYHPLSTVHRFDRSLDRMLIDTNGITQDPVSVRFSPTSC